MSLVLQGKNHGSSDSTQALPYRNTHRHTHRNTHRNTHRHTHRHTHGHTQNGSVRQQEMLDSRSTFSVCRFHPLLYTFCVI